MVAHCLPGHSSDDLLAIVRSKLAGPDKAAAEQIVVKHESVAQALKAAGKKATPPTRNALYAAAAITAGTELATSVERAYEAYQFILR